MLLVAENFLLAAQTASEIILRKESKAGYTTLVVVASYGADKKHFYFLTRIKSGFRRSLHRLSASNQAMPQPPT
jgi:hypothetical protein